MYQTIYQPRLLVVDDDERICEAIIDHLSEEACNSNDVDLAHTQEDIIKVIKNNPYDLVILDLKIPADSNGGEARAEYGLEALQKIKENNVGTNVIIITGYGTVENAVEAMKMGAYEFLKKPIDWERLLISVKNVLEWRRKVKHLSEQVAIDHGIIYQSKAMSDVMEKVVKVAESKEYVLIRGESGTGKELIAKAIHKLGFKPNDPFIAVNCSSIPESLAEAELFGIEDKVATQVKKRAGKFEDANGGILFLDEISEMDRYLQPKVLRAIQDRKIQRVGATEDIDLDIRIISATNKDLLTEIEKRTFREDLYYRLKVIEIVIPPLRERKEDIPLLAKHFLKEARKENGREDIRDFSKDMLQALAEEYTWPGNVRELLNNIKGAVVLCDKDTAIPIQLLLTNRPEKISALTWDEEKELSASIAKKIVAEHRLRFFNTALDKANGDRTKAGKLIGTSLYNFNMQLSRTNKVLEASP